MPRDTLTSQRDVREAYAGHSDELYGFAVRVLGETRLAEEAVEEAFLRAWRERDHFDPEIGNLRTWLFAILGDVVIDLGRARAARARVAGGVEGSGDPLELSVESLERSLAAWQVEEAMRRIGEQYRKVLVETYYRGRPYAEVAIELGVMEETVKTRVHDGLRALKVALAEVRSEG